MSGNDIKLHEEDLLSLSPLLDATTGALSQVQVKDAQNEITGYAWHRASQRILFATYAYAGHERMSLSSPNQTVSSEHITVMNS